ncbi:hypothetical protein MSSIT_2665 [Methanosarcina siciliae T4/M]|uniref:Uncharacterized protein n=1 Tax=Methanosarcina siciliae T4/M TaxID=1434120 RepID=A0A0E3P8R4_9EURY|nr:hypothetical protein [Methanosarcina siciliae]AKB29384.1 hypothetical protein MSSIT_2665 [Methanosarcina siciliae T4/M]
MNLDLVTIYETNFTIFIGIFVALAVMGTTTLYDRYKNKGGASVNPDESKLLTNLSQKIKIFSSGGLKHFPEYGKKLRSLIPKSSGSSRKMSGSNRKNSGSVKKTSGKNSLEKVGTVFLKAKGALQKLFASFSNKISSFSSSLLRRNKKNGEKLVSLSGYEETDAKLSDAEKVNLLDKVVESKKDELDLDDDFLTKISNTGTLMSNNPVSKGLEADTTEQFFGEMSSELDSSFDNDFNLDGSEFAIKVEGLEEESDKDTFAFNDETADIKFEDKSDIFLNSLRNDIIVSNEKKINFTDDMRGEDLDLKLIKADLEGVLKDLKKYRQFTGHN